LRNVRDRDLNRTYEKAKGGIFQPRVDKPAEDVIPATWKCGSTILGIHNLVDEVSFILRLLYPTGKNPAILRTENWKFLCVHKQIGSASKDFDLYFGSDEFESPKYPQANDRIARQIRAPPLPCKFFSKSLLINHGTILCCIVSATKSSKKLKINLFLYNQSFVTATMSFPHTSCQCTTVEPANLVSSLSNIYNYRIYNNPII